MRLLFFSTEFPNPFDPLKAVFNLHLMRALAARHEVMVIAPVPWVEEARGRASRTSPGCPDLGEISVYYPRYFYVPKALRRQAGRFLWWSSRRTIHDVLRRFTPDAVLGYWAYPDGAVAVRAARLCGAAAAVIVGGSDILMSGNSPGLRGRYLRTLRSADAVITVGRHLREAVIDYGVDAEKVHSWERGVDQGQFATGNQVEARRQLGLPTEGHVLLWAGRMVPVKAVHVLLNACARLRDKGVCFRLVLVGDGPLRPALQANAAELSLSESVTFAGNRPHAELPRWFQAADLTVLPSLSEGLPNVLRESVACGTRFVASRVGGIPEMATEPFDRLVPPGDPAALADAIAASLTQDLGHRPARRTRGWDEQSQELVRLLEPYVPGSVACPAPVHGLPALSLR